MLRMLRTSPRSDAHLCPRPWLPHANTRRRSGTHEDHREFSIRLQNEPLYLQRIPVVRPRLRQASHANRMRSKCVETSGGSDAGGPATGNIERFNAAINILIFTARRPPPSVLFCYLNRHIVIDCSILNSGRFPGDLESTVEHRQGFLSLGGKTLD